tara:strand:+ start:704 stop:1153 length:450 start_codon:yes stop_codon:yes gene_type:complete
MSPEGQVLPKFLRRLDIMWMKLEPLHQKFALWALTIQQMLPVLQRPVYLQNLVTMSVNREVQVKHQQARATMLPNMGPLLNKHALQVHTIQILHRKVQLRVNRHNPDFMSQQRDKHNQLRLLVDIMLMSMGHSMTRPVLQVRTIQIMDP